MSASIHVLDVTIIILPSSVSMLLKLLLRLVAFLLFLNPQCLASVSRCFFFSSRRRHTRCGRDWSSDVCSSDLPKTRIDVTRVRAGCLFEDLKTAGQVRLIQGKDVELVAWRETVRRTEPRPGKAGLCPKTSYWVFPAPLRPNPQRVERTNNGFLPRVEARDTDRRADACGDTKRCEPISDIVDIRRDAAARQWPIGAFALDRQDVRLADL